MHTRRRVLALAVAAVATASAPLPFRAQVLRNIPATALAAQLTTNSADSGTLGTGSTDIMHILLLDFGSSSANIRFVPGVQILSLDGRLLPTPSVINQAFKMRYQLDLYQQLLATWVISGDGYKAAVVAQSQAQAQSQWSERPTEYVPPGQPL